MPLAVIAVGGNSLITDNKHTTVADQYSAAIDTIRHITNMIEMGWNVVVTHGNGPQVGFILERSELARKKGLHKVPLDFCDADTQGAIGYIFQQVLENEFNQKKINKNAVTVVTRVLVDKNDPAFKKPSKPIGPFMEKAEALKKKAEDDWNIIEDAGRGYRRVVASPSPIEIIEEKAIETLIEKGFVVIAVGGGGIPVHRRDDGIITGIEAVIDKDRASALLAHNIDADLFMISTAVDKICLNYNKPDEKSLDNITLPELIKYKEEGHFCPGSMLPKVEAVIKYLESGGKKAIITSPSGMEASLNGEAGTTIIH
jgi:carbamate kinase